MSIFRTVLVRVLYFVTNSEDYSPEPTRRLLVRPALLAPANVSHNLARAFRSRYPTHY